MIRLLLLGWLVLCTLFMSFLFWLSRGSKDKFAKKLRVFGYSATIAGWLYFFISM
jgi:hypothetical protein